MKKIRTYVIILTFITFLMNSISIAYSADQPILQVSAEDIYLKAGQENTITIILKISKFSI
jgi:hypothetical protein